MKNKFFAGIAFLGLTAMIFTSCSKVPQAEIDAANVAIDSAKMAGAEVYVHESFVSLQDSLNSVMVSIEVQKSKLFKNYSVAKEHLVGVAQYAGEVKVQAVTRKEEVKTEVQNTITEVKTLIDADKQLITEAPKGKEGASALMAITAEVDAVEASVNEVGTLFEAGDYLVCLDKIKAAKEKATSINTELTEVIEKYKSKGKRK